MPLIVSKFGGSSVADAAQVRRVGLILDADPDRRVVVVSAPGKRHAKDQKVTDLLYLCHEHARQGIAFDEVWQLITDRFHEMARELGVEGFHDPLAEAREGIEREAGEGRGPDFAASRGEHLNARLLAGVLDAQFVDAAELIRFDARGRLDEAVTYPQIARRLAGDSDGGSGGPPAGLHGGTGVPPVGLHGGTGVPPVGLGGGTGVPPVGLHGGTGVPPVGLGGGTGVPPVGLGGGTGVPPVGLDHGTGGGGSRPLRRIIVPGFYGTGPDGQVRTFSRGGSDVTGAVLARGLGADVYENWTDVSGLLMADPRVVDSPRTIERLSYRELRELSYMGATVLHDEAVFPVRDAGIPVHIRNTNAPHDPGTLIFKTATDSQKTGDAPTITGVAGRRDFTAITVEKAMMNSETGFARGVLAVFEHHGISFEHMPSGIDTLSVVASDAALEGKLDAVLDDLRSTLHPDSIDVDPDLAVIATVGRGMAHTPGMAARVFNALAQAGINIRMIDQGSSELNIIVGVNTADFENAVRAIYAAFVD